jgi:putative ABC transport system permease protein
VKGGDPQQQPPPRAEQARVWRRYLRFFGYRGVEDLDEELAFHVEMRAHDYMAQGMSEAAARAAALQRLGDLTSARAQCIAVTNRTQRRMTRTRIIDSITQDIAFAVRTLGRNKGWTAVAIFTLALGIGANTAMFSVVNHLLLNPLQYPNADRVGVVFQAPKSGGPSGHNVMVTPKPKLIEAWRAHARSLETLEPYRTTDVTIERSGADPRTASVAMVFPSFARFAGARPIIGRMFTPAESKGEATVALLDEGTWRSDFGGVHEVLGSTVLVNGKTTTIIGVMPTAFALPRSHEGSIDLWMPLDLARHEFGTLTVARVREGITFAAAQRELDAIASRTETGSSDAKEYDTKLMAPGDMLGFKQSLVLLSVAVALVLLIACANVIHLLLARASTRQRELAIRAALGAGRGRLFRQLLTESALLSVAGCIGGLALGWVGLTLLVDSRPESLGDLATVKMDGATLAVTIAIAVVTALLFGVVGAIQAARHSTHDSLKAGTLASSASRGRGRGRSLLVVTEMALCTMLLVGAILLLRSVMHLQTMDPGFDPRGLYAIEMNLPEDRYKSDAAKRSFNAEALRRARQIPGVEAATLVASAPPKSTFLLGAIQIEGQPEPPAGSTTLIRFNGVAPEFFRMAGMRIVQGTTFTDTSAAAAQVVINEGMARQLWPGQSPLGRRLRVVYNKSGDWSTVVGVVGDARLSGLTSDAAEPIMYGAGTSMFHPSLLVRGAGESAFLSALTNLPRQIDPRLPPPQVQDVEHTMRTSMARPRFTLFLLGIFAIVAVGLAAVGLYGVLAYNVAQRTREIGIRMALGAPRRRVARDVLGQGMLMVVIGSAIGLIAARGGTRLLEHTLYGVAQTDVVSFAGAAISLVAIAMLASLVPVRRAIAIDPVIAMRAD